MLDINFIKQNKEAVTKNCLRRGSKVDIDKILEFSDAKNTKITQNEALKHQINSLSKSKPEPKQMVKLKELKEQTKTLQEEINKLEKELFSLLSWVPNMLSPDVPDGQSDADNVEIKKWGEIKEFNFTPKDHQELGENLDILDKERGAKVVESKYYFWKGDGARLVWALFSWAQNFLQERGFTFFLTPDLAQEKTLFGTGYLPFFSEDIYKIERSNLSLIGTSEQVLVAYHADEILEEKNLPLLYSGFSPCFRTEAGSYGKDTKGVFRVHQFNKLEQIVFCQPEESQKMHELCQKNEEDMAEALRIPHHRVLVCVGDCGAPGYKKYDLEAWFPSQNKYKEITSNTNLTDFQTRRLGIRYKTKDGNKVFPHTISATAVTDRWVLTILENYQQADGSVVVPEVLRPYMGGLEIIKKR